MKQVLSIYSVELGFFGVFLELLFKSLWCLIAHLGLKRLQEHHSHCKFDLRSFLIFMKSLLLLEIKHWRKLLLVFILSRATIK